MLLKGRRESKSTGRILRADWRLQSVREKRKNIFKILKVVALSTLWSKNPGACSLQTLSSLYFHSVERNLHTHKHTHTQSHTQSPVAFQTRHQPSSTFIAIVCVSSVAFAHLATKHFRTLTQHADGLYLMRRFRWEVLFGQMNAKVTVLHIVGVAGLTMFSHQTLSLITAEEV